MHNLRDVSFWEETFVHEVVSSNPKAQTESKLQKILRLIVAKMDVEIM